MSAHMVEALLSALRAASLESLTRLEAYAHPDGWRVDIAWRQRGTPYSVWMIVDPDELLLPETLDYHVAWLVAAQQRIARILPVDDAASEKELVWVS